MHVPLTAAAAPVVAILRLGKGLLRTVELPHMYVSQLYVKLVGCSRLLYLVYFHVPGVVVLEYVVSYLCSHLLTLFPPLSTFFPPGMRRS